MVKALLLFSGGLDSILACKILQKQNIKVIGLTFKSHFFNPENLAKKLAKQLKIKLVVHDFSKEHLEMVKNPKYGYGKNMNPCIDCHILMLKKAKEIMKKENCGFVATGEVLGERPMSQNKQSLKLVEKESSLEGYLIRPLSAKLLDETIPEKEGKVKRERLLDIKGKSRKPQLALAKKYRLKEYPTPAGGCLLTDPEFSKRLKEMFLKWPKCTGQDIELLKVGRIFWKNDNIIVVGRHKEDNARIEELAQAKDVLMKLKDFPGPLVLIRGTKIDKKVILEAGSKTAYYSTKARKLTEVWLVYGNRDKLDKKILIKQ